MGFNNGIPEYPINDEFWPNEIAEKFWPFLKATLENMIKSETNYVIEGEAVLPELINKLLKKHLDSIPVCFVGYINPNVRSIVRDIYTYRYGNYWLTNESNDNVERHISNMIEYSKRIKKSCENVV